MSASGAALLSVAFVVCIRADRDALHEMCREDGPIEWATALGFLAAAAGFARASAVARHSPSPAPSRLLLIVGAIASAVFFGEELSWGQRLLGFSTPEAVRSVNLQGEFNVHNVGALQWAKYTLLVATVAAVGIVLPLSRLSATARRLLVRARVPVAPLMWVPWFAASLFFLRHAANWLPVQERNDAQEVGELLFGLAVAGLGVHAATRPRDLLAAEAG